MSQITKKIGKHSFLHGRLQNFIANFLFPPGKKDWYKEKKYGNTNTAPFEDFINKQREPSGYYYSTFNGLNLNLYKLATTLTTAKTCELEVFKCEPQVDAPKKPGTGKHIVYFPGANTYYQACFRDISAAAKETGATIHAFNFPGTGLSTGKTQEANDLINSGLAVVANLIKKGVHPDNIILQGDCYGAAVAFEVKKQLERQADIKVRIVMNNAFKSFKAAIFDMITTYQLPSALKNIVKPLLQFTGWHLTPGKNYQFSDPYQCHIQHLSDQTLVSSSLSSKVAKYQDENKIKSTQSKNRSYREDTCPEEYRADRDYLDSMHYVRVSEAAKTRLKQKFGQDRYARVNAHFADLCELSMLHNAQSVYEGYINEYVKRSDAYIARHPQKEISEIHKNLLKLTYLGPAKETTVTKEEADECNKLMNVLQELDLTETPSNDDIRSTSMIIR